MAMDKIIQSLETQDSYIKYFFKEADSPENFLSIRIPFTEIESYRLFDAIVQLKTAGIHSTVEMYQNRNEPFMLTIFITEKIISKDYWDSLIKKSKFCQID